MKSKLRVGTTRDFPIDALTTLGSQTPSLSNENPPPLP